MFRCWIVLLFLCSNFFGCTRIPKMDHGVEYSIESKTGHQINWNKAWIQDPFITAYLYTLMNDPLTSESVVQIALFNNPEIQAIFQELEIAQADLLEAGLFSNPIFSLEVRYPCEKKLKTNIEYLITSTFLDVFMIPLRKKLAQAELEKVKRRVVTAILNIVFEVKKTFYELLVEERKIQYTISIAELSDISFEVVFRQREAGNINSLDLEQSEVKKVEAKVEILRGQTEITRLREKLTRLLGYHEESCFCLSDEMVLEVDDQELDLCLLESIALSERVDLQELYFEIIHFRRMLGLHEWWAYTDLQLGLAGERELSGLNVLGYGLGGEIPIFNFGQADRMRIHAQLKQAEKRYLNLKLHVLSEVRQSYKILMNSIEVFHLYESKLIPLQKKILYSSEELYNVMGLGLETLLENKRIELNSYRKHLENFKNYWISRVELDKALGGYLYRLLSEEKRFSGLGE